MSIKAEQLEYDQHCARLLEAINEEPEVFRRKGLTAELLFTQSKYKDCLPLFKEAVEGAKLAKQDNVPVWSGYYERVLGKYAMALDFAGDIAGAEGVYNTLLEYQPNTFYLGDYAFFLHRRKRNLVEAQVYYEKALDIYKNHSSIHLKYAGFLRHVRRDMVAAERHYVLAIKANPENPDALGSYASYLHGITGNINEAERYYKEAVRVDETHANNLCNYGLFLSEERQDYKNAELLYKMVLKNHPEHGNSLYNYAVMLDTHCQRKDDAEVLYQRCVQIEPRHAFALYNLGVLCEEKLIKSEKGYRPGERPDDPEKQAFCTKIGEYYRRAYDADSSDPTTAADFGRFLLIRLKAIDEADVVLTAAYKLDPNNIVAMFNLAVLMYKHKNDMEGACALLQKLRKASPNHVAGVQQLSRVYVSMFKRKNDGHYIEAAIECLEHALRIMRDPSHAIMEYLRVVNTLGGNKHKVKAIVFLDNFLRKRGGEVTNETDIRQLMKSMDKVAAKMKAKGDATTIATVAATGTTDSISDTELL